MQITLYKKSGCPWAAAVIGFLNELNVPVEIKNVTTHPQFAKEVEQKSRVPLLGDLTFIKKLDSPLPVAKGGRSVIAEQFRTIRTAISYTAKGIETKRILITSHRPGEGKSFTSLNLAASYALLHKKVVILEFDLRKPRLSKNLGLEPAGMIPSRAAAA